MEPIAKVCQRRRHIHILFSVAVALALPNICGASGAWITSPANVACSNALMNNPNEGPNSRLSLKAYDLLPEYIGEKILSRTTEERAMLRAYFGPGSIRVRNKDGLFSDLMGTGVRAMYVMDLAGEIYLDPEDRGSHSGILAGAPVAGAGYMTFNRDGSITVDNNSGHYKPDLDSLRRVVGVLTKRGVDITSLQVRWFSRDDR